jgi:outer membrane PBP1 activator LpoA protein
MNMKKNVEIRIINTSEMPPIVITQNDNDEPKVVVNTYHRIWISLNRQLIAGIIENMQEKMDSILTGYLQEQRLFEKEDLEFMEE